MNFSFNAIKDELKQAIPLIRQKRAQPLQGCVEPLIQGYTSQMGDFPKTPSVGSTLSLLLNLYVYAGGQRPPELAYRRWDAVNYREHFLANPVFVARDLRGTCKTLMGEIGVSKELSDSIRKHALQGVSSKHYDHNDYLAKKSMALKQWENRINNVEQAISNVVNLFQRG